MSSPISAAKVARQRQRADEAEEALTAASAATVTAFADDGRMVAGPGREAGVWIRLPEHARMSAALDPGAP
jgi:hypothetical protein